MSTVESVTITIGADGVVRAECDHVVYKSRITKICHACGDQFLHVMQNLINDQKVVA